MYRLLCHSPHAGIRHYFAWERQSPDWRRKNKSRSAAACRGRGLDFHRLQDRSRIMCAEAVPWRCHRSLIADALTARHIRVLHIMTPSQAQPHRLTPWAKITGHKVWYPGIASEGQLRGSAAKQQDPEIFLLPHPNITRILN
jgi:hypothetical protein